MDQNFIRKRLRQVLKDRGLSMREVSLKARLGDATVRNIVVGRTRRIGLDTLRHILEAIGIQEDDFFQRKPPQASPLAPATCQIPVYGSIPAGHPTWITPDSQPTDFVPGDARDQRYGAFALSVSGQSMAPKYLSGDILVLRPLDIALPIKDPSRPVPRATFDALVGRCVAVLVNGEATLKQLDIEQRAAGDYLLHLRPINPAYPILTVKDTDEVRLQGEVYKLIREE